MKERFSSLMGVATLLAIAAGTSKDEGHARIVEPWPEPQPVPPRRWEPSGAGSRERARRLKQLAKKEAGR